MTDLEQRSYGMQDGEEVRRLIRENERLTKMIEEFQREPYIVLSGPDGKYYKCYQLEQPDTLASLDRGSDK
jgi:hypothetical protein